MATPDIASLVQQGIAAYNAGDRDRAFRLLTEVLLSDPRNEVGWLWMSAVVTEQAERRYCLERVVEVNPGHEAAKRGLTKFPVDLASRSPLPTQPPAATLPRCTFPGCTEPVSRAGHILCYEHWKQSNRPKATAAPQLVHLFTASQIAERVELSPQRVNRLFAELGWIEQKGPNWLPTARGQALGAVKRHYPDSGKAYVSWPERILEHKAFRDAVGSVRGEGNSTAATSSAGFRKRFPAQHRTTDGHLVRSKAEMLVDNWLYMSEVVHAYERRLPIEEEVYCDFYLPAGKVYIEYWGLENDPAYNARRQTKTEIYRRYDLRLIELTDEHIRNLDDHLPKMLLKYGISVE